MSDRAILDAVRGDTPAELTVVLEQGLTREEAIRAQAYRAEKEAAELGAARDATAADFTAAFERVLAEADRKRDEALAEIDREDRAAREIPKRGTLELPDDYQARLLKLNIESTRSATAMHAAAVDIVAMSRTSDPQDVLDIVDQAFAAGDPAIIARVGRAGQQRLFELARIESRKLAPGDTPPSLRLKTALDVKLDGWRAAEAKKSPAGRREAVLAAHRRTRTQLEQRAGLLAEKFNLKDHNAVLQAAARKLPVRPK